MTRSNKNREATKKPRKLNGAGRKGSPAKKQTRKQTKKRAKKQTKENKDELEATLSKLTKSELDVVASQPGLMALLRRGRVDTKRVLRTLRYEAELERLQIELVKLQRSVQLSGRRIAILFEGRDAAGKGGAIRRFIEHLNPRTARTVALSKPTEVEQKQWYFQRYVASLPNSGEICFFDRSWYNRAVVEPVMGFCNEEQYRQFMRQVPEFEHMLYEDGIELVKFWFSISKDEQEERFKARKNNPLKQWKISPVDEEAQERWDVYTNYKQKMFSATHTTFSPWTIVKANSKKRARLGSIRHVLSQLPYDGKDETTTVIHPDPSIVRRFHRSTRQIDT